ncbi:DNA polymerase/3'-5' exonuclease PolX [Halomarina pelagica]|uniref:DNA polymerase/3'-5' exonuclease PolX n=1 Tax=Halomarina pelagica TaxID=2961599 RepID=UPI0020C471E4|nr:DNA polymerase/3'-5' exonuclease PolX [Halomarina sp. BND7]
MSVRNEELAALFEEFAALLEAQDVEYKPRAYRQAAENIRSHPEPVADLARRGGTDAVKEVNRVGDAIASKVVEYVETGEIEELEELRAELPVDMAALTSVEGVGPKTVGTLYYELGVRTLDDLEAAARAEEIREVPGFGAKTEENILANLDFARQSNERQLLSRARPLADEIQRHFADVAAVGRSEVAGSLRRWKPTIGDVDLLVASDDPEAVVEAFTGWEDADAVIEAGPTKASVRSAGIRVDLRVVAPEEFGAALQHFTGSRDHNISVRDRAIERGLKVNEYGVFDVSDVDDPDAGQRVGERLACETEADVYAAIDLPLVPPELREDRGEVEAAAEDRLPDLIEESDVRGDLHVHTTWSDGRYSVREMVEAAEERGYDYVNVSDHATGPGMVGGVGLSDDELEEQLAEVREVGDDADIEVFAGVEANVGEDGSVSVGDALLEQLDCVVASPHSALDGDGTERLVRAAEHPEVDVIGHPTGRMLNQRSGLDIDVSTVATAAAEANTALEINASPSRLDLSGGAVKLAIEQGATVVVDTDAHSPSNFDLIRYGVHTARRGWAEVGDVLNAWETDDVRAFLER